MKNAACAPVCAVKHKPSQLSLSAAVHLYSARNRRLVAVALVSFPSSMNSFKNRNMHSLHFSLFFSRACKKIKYTAVFLMEYSNSYFGVCVYVFIIYLKVHLGVGSSAPRCCRFRRACGWSWSGRAGPVWDIWPTNSSPNSTVRCPYWPHPHNSSHR